MSNNPVRFNDPSGHLQEDDDYDCHGCTTPQAPIDSNSETEDDKSSKLEDELDLEPSSVIPEYALNQLGIYCGENVDPLACKVYTDTKSFIYTVSVNYKYKFLNYVAYLSCQRAGQGCIFEDAGGYRLDPRLRYGPNFGQVTWDRYLIPWNSSSSQPLFRAAWGLNSSGTMEMETFPLADGTNSATVILKASAKNQSIYWNSQAILFNGNPVALTEPEIQFVTSQTGENTIQSIGTLSIAGQVLGTITVNGVYMP